MPAPPLPFAIFTGTVPQIPFEPRERNRRMPQFTVTWRHQNWPDYAISAEAPSLQELREEIEREISPLTADDMRGWSIAIATAPPPPITSSPDPHAERRKRPWWEIFEP